MKMKIGGFLSIFFLIFSFSVVSSPVFAAKHPKRIVIGANLKEYKQPIRRQCDVKVPLQYATIQEAINAVSSGNTICVSAGTYNENVLVNKSIRLSGKGAFKTVINGQVPGFYAMYITANNVTLEGFFIQAVGTNDALQLAESISGTNIRYNYLKAGYGAIAFLVSNAQTGNIVQNNILEGNNSPFIAQVGAISTEILNNTFIGSVNPSSRLDTGFALDANGPNTLIQRNVFNTSGSPLALIAFNNTSVINENNFNSDTIIKLRGPWAEPPVNAENNWWGDTDPSDNFSGNVDFTPFASSPFLQY